MRCQLWLIWSKNNTATHYSSRRVGFYGGLLSGDVSAALVICQVDPCLAVTMNFTR